MLTLYRIEVNLTCPAKSTNPLSSDDKKSCQFTLSPRYAHNCLQLDNLIKMSTTNHKSVVLEFAIKPGQAWYFQGWAFSLTDKPATCMLGLVSQKIQEPLTQNENFS